MPTTTVSFTSQINKRQRPVHTRAAVTEERITKASDGSSLCRSHTRAGSVDQAVELVHSELLRDCKHTEFHLMMFSVSQEELNKGIASFYDESSGLWEQMWGEHMHHGYYPQGGPKKSNQEAQIDMIEEVLSWAGVTEASKVFHLHQSCTTGKSLHHKVSNLCFKSQL